MPFEHLDVEIASPYIVRNTPVRKSGSFWTGIFAEGIEEQSLNGSETYL